MNESARRVLLRHRGIRDAIERGVKFLREEGERVEDFALVIDETRGRDPEMVTRARRALIEDPAARLPTNVLEALKRPRRPGHLAVVVRGDRGADLFDIEV